MPRAFVRRALLLAALAPPAWAAFDASVTAARSDRGATPARSAAINPGPAINVMVVGAGNVILIRPRAISVPATAVTTSHGPCGVAGATPLSALVALRRVGGPPFSIRDYGHCTSSPGNSGELFVSSLDGETNHGQNGWEYKVNSRSGTTGAGDTSGPFGNGRLLASGSRVLWFWCQSFAGGCQRNLEVSVPSSVSPGAPFTVAVTGYDNNGRGQPMSGAHVSVTGSSAVTNGSGRATLRAPSRSGSYGVRASRTGSVPSFPGVVLVR
jgi:hypothetical protein